MPLHQSLAVPIRFLRDAKYRRQSCVWCAAVTGACVLLLGLHATAQRPDAEQAAEPPAEQPEQVVELAPHELAIQQSAVSFVEAYNVKDAQAIAELFGPEARMEEADGQVFEGRDAIQAAFAASFKDNPQAAISVAMDSIRLVTPEVVVEVGAVEYFRDGDTLSSRSPYVVTHLNKDGVWRMDSVRTLKREVVSSYEHLRDLEFLVGDWIDEGADADVETSCYWDEDKHYLLQEFQVISDGEVTLTGTQRIGWDPQSQQFHAWTHDSDGGFCEASWTPVEEGWVITSTGVAADGAAASSVRTLTRVDPDHLLLSSEDCLRGEERLPDFEVTMVRRPPLPQDVTPVGQ